MVILPIEKKLRKRMHKTIALVQDIMVMEIYNHFTATVIHGGTAMWRCYGGNRFSEDIDAYLPLSAKTTGFEKFLEGLKNKGFIVEKFKQTDNSIFSKFSYLGAIVRFEAVFKNIAKYVTKPFETSDGNFILVNTLEPAEMIKEKVSAYKERKKVRDLYDIFHLLNLVEDKSEIKGDLEKLLNPFTKPVDEKELKTLIISGSIPTVDEMLSVMRRWSK